MSLLEHAVLGHRLTFDRVQPNLGSFGCKDSTKPCCEQARQPAYHTVLLEESQVLDTAVPKLIRLVMVVGHLAAIVSQRETVAQDAVPCVAWQSYIQSQRTCMHQPIAWSQPAALSDNPSKEGAALEWLPAPELGYQRPPCLEAAG